MDSVDPTKRAKTKKIRKKTTQNEAINNTKQEKTSSFGKLKPSKKQKKTRHKN